jgi:hypothetical protein
MDSAMTQYGEEEYINQAPQVGRQFLPRILPFALVMNKPRPIQGYPRHDKKEEK